MNGNEESYLKKGTGIEWVDAAGLHTSLTCTKGNVIVSLWDKK